MAKINLIQGPMSGSLGGATYSHNKGGAYVRKRSIPTNPNALKQQAARAILATLSSAWSLLTDTQRAEWADYAVVNPIVDSLGQSIFLSGQQHYVGLNARLLGAGAARVDSAPTGTGPAQLTTVTPTLTAPGTISIVFAPTPAAAGLRIVCWCTIPSTAGRNPNFRAARLIGYTAAAAASPAVFTSPYPAIATQVSNLYVAVMDAAGRLSPYQRARSAWA